MTKKKINKAVIGKKKKEKNATFPFLRKWKRKYV